MTRKYIKSKNRNWYKPDDLRRALQLIKIEKKTMRKVAQETGIKLGTLAYYLQKFSTKDIQDIPTAIIKADRKFISVKHESMFVKYLCSLPDVYIGLYVEQLKKLVYEWSVANNIEVPRLWSDVESAGIEWCNSFVKRHKELKYDPEDTAKLTTVVDYNKNGNEIFFDKLEFLIKNYNVKPKNIWNMDQIGVCTTYNPSRVVFRKYSINDNQSNENSEVTDVSKIEKGEIVTAVFTISATGNTLPPVFIFPRKELTGKSLENAPEGSCGLCNSDTWMSADHFIEYLKHFVSKVRRSKGEKCILILDKDASPLSMVALENARENNIIMLTLPARRTAKLQPLSKPIFDLFQKLILSACKKWNKFHEGQKISVDNVPSIVSSVYSSIFSPFNIKTGFLISGIHPLNRDSVFKTKYPKLCYFEEDG